MTTQMQYEKALKTMINASESIRDLKLYPETWIKRISPALYKLDY